MRAVLLAALACAAGLAGCSQDPETASSCPEVPYGTVHYGSAPAGDVDPRQPTDIPYIITGLIKDQGPRLVVNVTDGSGPVNGDGNLRPFNWTLFPSDLPGQRLASLRLDGAVAQQPGTYVNWRIRYGADSCSGYGGFTHNLAFVADEGMILTAGHGTHAFYAGFWENGTLFETNIEDFDHSDWPRAGWYESIPYDPLPVYIYDQARSEQPAHWKAPPGVPASGTPVDGPVGTATSAPGLGYYTTIKGFNDNLKGLSTTSARVFRMDAKDAYPEGTPNNPLAGDNLVFYVYLQDVVDYPCPTPAAGPTPQCPSSP
ncbi:MAG TPA: hypothetical protein VM286_04705 [Candidatus Thermoplasmatota archaeon]|nr:hypothetical protein [Candidatus Thermoplasmatota archaeon]